MLAAIVGGVVLLALFPFVESRAAEPILPLELFRNATFRTASAISFVIGFALFGSVTFVPLYLQVVKGHSATESGLLMTPMMLGLLVTGITSGLLISRYGRYRPFPIIGTAVSTVGLYLLSRLGVETPTSVAAAYMLILGLGLGMVMQVLVLAAQNAVDYRLLGVATSGATLARRSAARSACRSSARSSRTGSATSSLSASRRRARADAREPRRAHHLPPLIHALYIAAVAAALHPVFLTAAGVMVAAFGLSWLLHDVPLRETAGADAPAQEVPADAYAGGASSGGSRNAGRGRGLAGAPATLRR